MPVRTNTKNKREPTQMKRKARAAADDLALTAPASTRTRRKLQISALTLLMFAQAPHLCSASCDPATFSPPADLAASAYEVVAGDFNRDGKQDFVTSEFNVSLFIGNGSGGFLAPKVFPTAQTYQGFHWSITARDLNNDGYSDLILPNEYSSISVLLNDKAGGFKPATVFPVGHPAYQVAVGDFNHDNKADVAVATSNGVSVLLGNGAGGFGAPSEFAVGGPVPSVVVRDFNRDGNPDLAVDFTAAKDSHSLSIYLGDGLGSFTFGGMYTLFTGTGNVGSMVGADFNHDGYADLAVAVHLYSDHTVAVFLGDGSGGLTRAPDILLPYASRLATADFDSDGNVDIAISGDSSQFFAVARGDGAGNFIVTQRGTGPRRPRGIAAADFNGDSKPDLVLATRDKATVYLNLPTVTISAPDATASEPGTDTGRVKVTRTGCPDDPLVIHYTVGGTAQSAIDYTPLTGSITIPAGKSSASFDVVAVDDSVAEPAETVIATLALDANYSVGAKRSATVTIADND